MKKRYLNELSKEELEKVFEKNGRLRELLNEYTQDTESFYISDQLEYLRDSISDYSIDPYGYSFISVRNSLDFMFDVKRLCKDMAILSESEKELYLDKAEELSKEIYHEGNDSVKNNIAFVTAIADLRDVILGKMLEHLRYADSDEALKNFFMDVFIYDNTDMYIDDHTNVLKKDITETYA